MAVQPSMEITGKYPTTSVGQPPDLPYKRIQTIAVSYGQQSQHLFPCRNTAVLLPKGCLCQCIQQLVFFEAITLRTTGYQVIGTCHQMDKHQNRSSEALPYS